MDIYQLILLLLIMILLEIIIYNSETIKRHNWYIVLLFLLISSLMIEFIDTEEVVFLESFFKSIITIYLTTILIIFSFNSIKNVNIQSIILYKIQYKFIIILFSIFIPIILGLVGSDTQLYKFSLLYSILFFCYTLIYTFIDLYCYKSYNLTLKRLHGMRKTEDIILILDSIEYNINFEEEEFNEYLVELNDKIDIFTVISHLKKSKTNSTIKALVNYFFYEKNKDVVDENINYYIINNREIISKMLLLAVKNKDYNGFLGINNRLINHLNNQEDIRKISVFSFILIDIYHHLFENTNHMDLLTLFSRLLNETRIVGKYNPNLMILEEVFLKNKNIDNNELTYLLCRILINAQRNITWYFNEEMLTTNSMEEKDKNIFITVGRCDIRVMKGENFTSATINAKIDYILESFQKKGEIGEKLEEIIYVPKNVFKDQKEKKEWYGRNYIKTSCSEEIFQYMVESNRELKELYASFNPPTLLPSNIFNEDSDIYNCEFIYSNKKILNEENNKKFQEQRNEKLKNLNTMLEKYKKELTKIKVEITADAVEECKKKLIRSYGLSSNVVSVITRLYFEKENRFNIVDSEDNRLTHVVSECIKFADTNNLGPLLWIFINIDNNTKNYISARLNEKYDTNNFIILYRMLSSIREENAVNPSFWQWYSMNIYELFNNINQGIGAQKVDASYFKASYNIFDNTISVNRSSEINFFDRDEWYIPINDIYNTEKFAKLVYYNFCYSHLPSKITKEQIIKLSNSRNMNIFKKHIDELMKLEEEKNNLLSIIHEKFIPKIKGKRRKNQL